eukprot:gene7993-16357_t
MSQTSGISEEAYFGKLRTISTSSGRMSFRLLLSKLKQIATGTKKLLLESKDVTILQFKKPDQSSRNRQEKELIRRNLESVKKIALFLVAQAPPIIGLIPVFIALRYPRHLLTPHYWDEEETSRFLIEEMNQRKQGATLVKQYISQIMNMEIQQFKKKIQIDKDFVNVFAPHGPLFLDSLSHTHIVALSRANALSSIDLLLSSLPSFILKNWLRKRALVISDDDKLLLTEDITSLSKSELISATVLRGIDPNLSESELRTKLKLWLKHAKDVYKRKDDGLLSSLIVHSTAIGLFLPEL